MNNFFVSKEIYKERLDICRGCEHYFKITGNCKICGCFMRIKASMGIMDCPEKYWEKTIGEMKPNNEIPKHLIRESFDVWEGIKTGEAIDFETKERAVQLYNTIYQSNFKLTTNCVSCLNTVRLGIKRIVDEQNN